ncbi:MAG TPA: S1 RNA-binding domain-containing protein [Erysipelotrichaceae bacterium]|nr:S1 RNA-binding domain-containing protein [Erysipelotrichaceae bacterium]
MEYQVGQLILGKVYDVKPYALLMSFEDDVTGLLHISEISDSFIRDIEKYGSIGDEMRVKILSIDEDNGFLRVSYKQVPKEEAFSSHVNRRKAPVMKENEFLPLEEKLDDWIEEAYQKIEKKSG